MERAVLTVGNGDWLPYFTIIVPARQGFDKNICFLLPSITLLDLTVLCHPEVRYLTGWGKLSNLSKQLVLFS